MARPHVALVRATPDTVLADYQRLLELAGPLALPAQELIVAATPPAEPLALPGERAEPWQLEGTLQALRHCRRPVVALHTADEREPLVAAARASGGRIERYGGAQAHVLLAGASQYEQLARLVLDGHPPLLAVLDATTLCRRAPFAAPQISVRNLLVASTDPVAAASVAARLAGVDPLRSGGPIALAHRSGLGCADLDAVTIAGEAGWLHSCAPPPAARPPALVQYAWRLWRRSGRQRTAEQQVYEDWLFHTGWGRLYRAYQRRAIGREAR